MATLIHNTLEKEQETLFEKIKEKALKINPNVGAIWDGVADLKAYCNSSPRVAWILKEPYDKDNNGEVGGGHWSHPDLLANSSLEEIESKPTWRRVNRTMCAIRQNASTNDSIVVNDNYLKDIAWLNLNKTPGASTSGTSFKRKFIKHWSELLKKQIEVYAPEVIIFGSTFDICKSALFPDCVPIDKGKYLHVYTLGDKLLLYAYHPGWWGITDDNYINSILNAIKTYR